MWQDLHQPQLSRQSATELLRPGAPGSFVLRGTSDAHAKLVLSVKKARVTVPRPARLSISVTLHFPLCALGHQCLCSGMEAVHHQ
jgi:hypothetical protein